MRAALMGTTMAKKSPVRSAQDASTLEWNTSASTPGTRPSALKENLRQFYGGIQKENNWMFVTEDLEPNLVGY